jgi:vesicle-fusing ATPase
MRSKYLVLVIVVVELSLLAPTVPAFFIAHSNKKIAAARPSLRAATALCTNPNDSIDSFASLTEAIAVALTHSALGNNHDDAQGSAVGWKSWMRPDDARRIGELLDGLDLHQEHFIRWIQLTPAPMIVDYSSALQQHVARDMNCANPAMDWNRIQCKLLYLPSGETLRGNLQSSPGTIIFGKLLCGGVSRYRLVGLTRRKVGVQTTTILVNGDDKSSSNNESSWLQYGGPERNYRALDIGPCMLVEIALLPEKTHIKTCDQAGNMILEDMMNIEEILLFKSCLNDKEVPVKKDRSTYRSRDNDFCEHVGGLQPQIDEIVRRVLDGRVVQSVRNNNNTPGDDFSQDLANQKKEMQELLDLGLEPVRGLLLYGPPGCGKSFLAREISKLLDARPAKIIAAPELLDRWVGGSEQIIRDLFRDAEEELAKCDGDPTLSALHVVVIDEIDAVFRKRAMLADDSGEATRASAVNQILAKLDGINAISNVLVIGMTNRKDLLDPALLRPGRLEVHIDIPFPDKEGRREILQIHLNALRIRGRLSQPLCQALDGKLAGNNESSMIRRLVFNLKSKLTGATSSKEINDLAADQWTGAFSGADLAGLVRCAGSIALARSRKLDSGDIYNLLITIDDVLQALDEVKR